MKLVSLITLFLTLFSATQVMSMAPASVGLSDITLTIPSMQDTFSNPKFDPAKAMGEIVDVVRYAIRSEIGNGYQLMEINIRQGKNQKNSYSDYKVKATVQNVRLNKFVDCDVQLFVEVDGFRKRRAQEFIMHTVVNKYQIIGNINSTFCQ